jgi:CheY-like chemotaxis protein
MTGYGQAEDKRRARERGFDAHLTKPTDPAELERLLARLPAAGPAPVPSVERTFF